MDITFKAEDGKFNLRVGALIHNKGKLLMASNPSEGDNVLYSVGGRVKYGETFEEAARREVLEETGIDCAPKRMIAIHENYFVNFVGCPYHEISIYFLFEDERLNEIHSGHLTEDGPDGEKLLWVSPEDDSLTIFPFFYRNKDIFEDKGIRHYITREDSWYRFYGKTPE